MMYRILNPVLFLLIIISSDSLAQEKRINYWNDSIGMIQEQAFMTFNQIDKVLDLNRPQLANSEIRKLALFSLDVLLHDTRNDNGRPLRFFIEKRINNVLHQLSTDKVKKGFKVYKLYNHAFIVRTSSITIGFDIVRGGPKSQSFISDSLMTELTKHIDVMFVTHFHGDHADSTVANMFVKQNKNVIVPPGLWENRSERIKHVRDSTIYGKILEVSSDKLKVRILPGHQGSKVLNNIYAVTTQEGYTFVHTGDQQYKDDFKWIGGMKDSLSIDVLFINGWTTHLEEMVSGFNPKLIVIGHENEMNHSIDHREPYWLMYQRMNGIGIPNLLMTWGESFQYN